ncbi:hypothetical protein NEOC95_000337 [Neochlamydia sp. AcF95]|nr:hypothetical protein [Neochlamydia sp. AcF95]
MREGLSTTDDIARNFKLAYLKTKMEENVREVYRNIDKGAKCDTCFNSGSAYSGLQRIATYKAFSYQNCRYKTI